MILESFFNFVLYCLLYVLISIDLDGFKDINDDFGYDIGDFVFQYVVWVLECVVFGDNIVFWLGGDEFVIVFVQVDKNYV